MTQTPAFKPDATVADIMELHPQTLRVFMRYRMLCIGCAVSPFHTVEEACLAHDLDEAAFTADLSASIREGAPE